MEVKSFWVLEAPCIFEVCLGCWFSKPMCEVYGLPYRRALPPEESECWASPAPGTPLADTRAHGMLRNQRAQFSVDAYDTRFDNDVGQSDTFRGRVVGYGFVVTMARPLMFLCNVSSSVQRKCALAEMQARIPGPSPAGQAHCATSSMLREIK